MVQIHSRTNTFWLTSIPSALSAVKGQARWRGSLWSPLTAVSRLEFFKYERPSASLSLSGRESQGGKAELA